MLRTRAAALLSVALIVSTVAAGGIEGCGLALPRPRPASRVADSGASREAGARRSHVAAPASGEPSQAQAVADFAEVYINWTAGTVARELTGLALASVGQARAEMSLAAAQTARDSSLHDGGVSNSGTVEALAPFAGAAGRWVVVTLERTSTRTNSSYAGLAPAWHVTLATVARLASGRWVVSGWQPES
jgi:hypothetical protein